MIFIRENNENYFEWWRIGAKFVKNALSEFRRRKDQFKVLLRSAEQPKKHKHALKMYTNNRPDADAIQ